MVLEVHDTMRDGVAALETGEVVMSEVHNTKQIGMDPPGKSYAGAARSAGVSRGRRDELGHVELV